MDALTGWIICKWLCDKSHKWLLRQPAIEAILLMNSVNLGDLIMRNRTRVSIAFLATMLSLMLALSTDAFQNPALAAPRDRKDDRGSMVYVCACLKTKSCSCMTEAKMQGPCACGTEGGPPMKAVPPNSDWAKENRDALAK